MRVSRVPILALTWALLGGCEAHDYGLGSPSDSQHVEPGTHIKASFDAVFQRTGWGADVTRCQVQLAFYAVWEADGHGSGAPDQRVDYPVSEGTCAYSSFDDQEEEGGALVARGSLDGGPAAWLIGSEHTVELTRFVDRRGYIYYDLDPCEESTFPFGDAFDVDLPDAPEDGPLDGFFAREAVAIGPRLDLVGLPEETTPGEPLSHVQDDPFWVEWDYRGELAEVREESLIRSEMAMVRNIELGEDWGFEALACRPEEDRWQLEVSVWDLERLAANPTDGDALYYTAFQLDVRTSGPEVEVGTVQFSRNASTLTEGGIISIREPVPEWDREPVWAPPYPTWLVEHTGGR